MKRLIAIFTATRAEYGLLYWLMKDIQASTELELQVIVSGSHLSPEFGETWKKIQEDGFPIDAKVEMLLSSNSPVGVVKSIGLGTIGFGDVLDRLKPDILVVLGDRFELLSIAQAALIMRIPIAHLHGGEITEGAYDDSIRHAITKIASLHFVAAESYRGRVLQMGEKPESVFNVGALGLDSRRLIDLATLAALRSSLGVELREPYFIVTYHPVTRLDEDPQITFRNILESLDFFPTHQAVLTYPNADNGGRGIITLLEDFARERPGRVFAFPSLGSRLYLSALAGAAAVIGNSSSGIIEAPAFGIPTVNIGLRQLGRLAAKSVLHCQGNKQDIIAAISMALSTEFKAISKHATNPYGQGDASNKIVDIIKSIPLSPHKSFSDLSG